MDQTGQWVPGSFGYAPLIDFARHVEHFTKNSTPVRSAVAQALAAIDDREARLRDSFDAIAQTGVVGYPAVSRVLGRVRNPARREERLEAPAVLDVFMVGRALAWSAGEKLCEQR